MKKEQIIKKTIQETELPTELDYYNEESIKQFEEEEEIDGYISGFMTGYLAA